MSNHDHLPECYVADDGTRVSAPVYRLLADCFLGAPGKPPGLWEAGTELQHDLCPNEHMQPLNRAAAEQVETWQTALPIVNGRLTDVEIGEAAALMAPKDGEQVLPFPIYWAGVIKLAGELKARKAGPRVAPPVSYVTPFGAKVVPPMTAGDFKDVSHRDAAATGLKPHEQSAKRMKPQARPSMSAEPRPPASDGVEGR